MKKFAIAALSLVLAVSVLTGCGCMNSNAPMESTTPTMTPTTESTRPSAMPSESQTPTAGNSAPSESGPMTDGGSGMTEGGSMNGGGSGMTEGSSTTESTETTPPMSKESGRVKSHVNGNF